MEPNGHGQTPTDTAGSPPTQKRQRAKQACEPCRLRKRKCDGSLPCNMCTQFEYKCYFEKHSRKRSKRVENAQLDSSEYGSPSSLLREGKQSTEEMSNMRSMEANSGIAFTRLLGLRLDSSAGPKLFTFGWNLGSCNTAPGLSLLSHLPSTTELISYDQFSNYATLYFDNVHPLYGFLDKELILEQAKLRWTEPSPCKVPDHLFAGIAACASLFSPTEALNHILPKLVELQKLVLENTSTQVPCTLMDVQSWLLRSLYLRGTGHPHATHMASCNAIHLAEAIGLHQECSSTTLHSPEVSAEDPEIRRRTFWISRMLNTFVSFEYGRTRVMLRGITIGLPTPREGDYTVDYIDLYSLSCCLDPEVSDKAGQWEDFLRRLEAYESRHDCIALSKANLAMCGYRRLRLANPNLGPEVIHRIISMGLKGLECARSMATKGYAWWHVANVPFQVICVFLAMDIRESLSHLNDAMSTLEFVVDRFRTVTMKEALRTARFLVRLSKQRKDEDSDVLAISLKNGRGGGVDMSEPQSENLQHQQPHQQQQLQLQNHHQHQHQQLQLHQQQLQASLLTRSPNAMSGSTLNGSTPQTASSTDDWSMDILGNSQFDWNFFLTADMPAFADFAPDGTM